MPNNAEVTVTKEKQLQKVPCINYQYFANIVQIFPCKIEIPEKIKQIFSYVCD